jgi:hypothetical protein
MPEGKRPSLRQLARERGTSHQLLSHLLEGLEGWRRNKGLEQFRANAAAAGVPFTPAMERRYWAWVAKEPARAAKEAARQAKWQAKLDAWHAAHPGFADRVRELIARVEAKYARPTEPQS